MSSTIAAGAVVDWLRAFADAVARERDHLTELDAAIGDADHGVNMDRGMQAVAAKLADPDAGAAGPAGAAGQTAADGEGPTAAGGESRTAAGGESRTAADGAGQTAPISIGALLKTVGMTLTSTVGGAAGPLYGTLFLRMGASAGDRPELTLPEWAAALDAGVKGVQARGRAQPGDKTMVDALLPAAAALTAAAGGTTLADALRAAAAAAEEGMKATIPLVARKGRASYLGERSAGHQDPGATSSWLLLETAAETLAGVDLDDG